MSVNEVCNVDRRDTPTLCNIEGFQYVALRMGLPSSLYGHLKQTEHEEGSPQGRIMGDIVTLHGDDEQPAREDLMDGLGMEY